MKHCLIFKFHIFWTVRPVNTTQLDLNATNARSASTEMPNKETQMIADLAHVRWQKTSESYSYINPWLKRCHTFIKGIVTTIEKLWHIMWELTVKFLTLGLYFNIFLCPLFCSLRSFCLQWTVLLNIGLYYFRELFRNSSIIWKVFCPDWKTIFLHQLCRILRCPLVLGQGGGLRRVLRLQTQLRRRSMRVLRTRILRTTGNDW